MVTIYMGLCLIGLLRAVAFDKPVGIWVLCIVILAATSEIIRAIKGTSQ